MTRKHVKLFIVHLVIAACGLVLVMWLGRAKPVRVLIAGVVPARRAAMLDPVEALRPE